MSSSNENDTYSIREFFSGKGVMVTGCTGLVGKALVEKILRAIPDVRKVFLFIRPRAKADGTMVDSRQRLREEVLNNSAFDRLRRMKGDRFEAWFEEKVACVPGDLQHKGLGLDSETYERLVAETDIVIHPAATVNFSELLDVALELNALGPCRLLDFARAAKASFVQISTAYVCGNRRGTVPERLLDPIEAINGQLPPDAPRPSSFSVEDEIERLAEQCDRLKAECASLARKKGWAPDSEEARTTLKRALVSAGMRRSRSLGWNDTYTYTKFLGEQMLKLKHDEVPTVIVRPSIIESSMQDPEPGWLQNLRVADPLIVNFGKGRLMDFPANRSVVMDLIPADLVINGILAATAHTGAKPGAFDLIHVSSSAENPLVFEKMYQIVRDYFKKNPMLDRAGQPVAVPKWNFPTVEGFKRRVKNRYLRPMKVASALVNGPVEIPGTRKLKSRLRTLNVVFEQLLDQVDQYSFYTHLDCRFETNHAREIRERMIPEERPDFDFDARKIHWRHYLQEVHIPGLKRNILRMESGPKAQRRAAGQKPESSAEEEIVVQGLPRTIVELAARGADRYGDKPFLSMRRGGRQITITFSEIYEQAGEWARTLRARLGLEAGDRVVLWSENCPEWALAYLAIMRAGCTAVPLDREMDREEVERLTHFVDAKGAILSPDVFETVRHSIRFGQKLPPLLNPMRELEPHPGSKWTYPQADVESTPLVAPKPDALASILFTSGTTLQPKGVMLSHSNFLSDALSVAEVLEPLSSDRFLSVLPLHHAFEFTGGFLGPWLGGATIHHIERLRMQDVVDTMKDAGITVVLAVPRLYQLFADGIKARVAAATTTEKVAMQVMASMADAAEKVQGEQARKRFFAKAHEAFGGKLRLFISGGASLDPEIFHFFKRLGISIAEGYGLTETAPILTVNPLENPKPGSVGKPIPGVEMRVHEPDARGVGEIQVRGPMIMNGYWREPEATDEAFAEGWFRTGDLGRIGQDGYLYLAGRKDDVIVTAAGKKVFPEQLEGHFRELGNVKEACVVGLPNRFGQGDEVALAVIPEKHEHESDICQSIEAINRNLPSHQRVARIEMMTGELPRTATRKVQRRKIQARCSDPRRASSVRLPHVIAEDATDESQRVILEQIRSAISEIVGVPKDQVLLSSNLQSDLGLDSIGRVDLVGRLELRLSISIPDDVLGKAWTVQELVEAIREARNADRQGGRAVLGALGDKIWSRPVPEEVRAQDEARSISKSLIQGAMHTTAKVLLNMYLSIDASGRENLPTDGSYILASNHTSHLDIVAIREALGPQAANLHVMAARDYFFDARLKSWFLTSAWNLLPMERDRISPENIRRCHSILDAGRSLLIFPEATRSVSGELQRFKSVIGILALELDFPILPVHISGTYEALPKGSSIPRPANVFVRIGPVIDFSELRRRREELQEEGRRQQKRPPGLTGLYRKAAGLVHSEVEALSRANTRQN